METAHRWGIPEAILRRPDKFRQGGIPPPHLFPARQPDIQRLQPLPVRRREGGNHRPGPVPRAGPGPRAQLLRMRRSAVPALPAEHFQGDTARPGHTNPHDRQSDALGRAGSAAAQRHAHREGTPGCQPPAQRMGAVHRRRDKGPQRRPPEPRIHSLGRLRQKQGVAHRPGEAPRAPVRTPIAPLSQPRRMVRQPSLLPLQRIPEAAQHHPNKLVKGNTSHL